jgi:hypothetical protein
VVPIILFSIDDQIHNGFFSIEFFLPTSSKSHRGFIAFHLPRDYFLYQGIPKYKYPQWDEDGNDWVGLNGIRVREPHENYQERQIHKYPHNSAGNS